MSDATLCSVPGCSQPLYQSRTFCGAHRARWYRYGDPLGTASPTREDLTGQRFGELVVLEYSAAEYRWRCQCDCGARTSVRSANLRNGSTRTCGVKRRHVTPASYDAAHERVRAVRGRAREHGCERCGAPAAQWAYRRLDAAERHDTGPGPWSPDPYDYMPLCVPCHKRYDAAGIAIEHGAIHLW